MQTLDGDFYRSISYVQARLTFWRVRIGYILKLYYISVLLFKTDVLDIYKMEVFAAPPPSTNTHIYLKTEAY